MQDPVPDGALARGVLGRPGVGTRQNEQGPEERIAGRLARAPLDHVPVGGQLQDWADHYSTAASYLRLNGILPPTAAPPK